MPLTCFLLRRGARAVYSPFCRGPHVWQLKVEYSDRKLEIKGEDRFINLDKYPEYGHLPGIRQYEDLIIISNNIDIAMAYERIQFVWDALGKYIIKGEEFPLLEGYP